MSEEEKEMPRVLSKIPRPLLVVGVLALALLAVSCREVAAPPNGDVGPPPDGAVTFDVSMGDNFFEPKEFTVGRGQTVTFNLTNDGRAVHNMRIAGRDGRYNTADDADSGLLRRGETAVLVWTAPTAPGRIDFRCDLHPEQIGTIIVR
jgi:plastocyanin